MPNRHASSDKYRYGFQGQEKDDEVKGEGNSLNYKFRMYDPRVGRFFAVDPLTKKYPELTPYQFSSNMLIHAPELEGLETSWDLNSRDPNFQFFGTEGRQRIRNVQGMVGLGALTILTAGTAFEGAAAYDLLITGGRQLLINGATGATVTTTTLPTNLELTSQTISSIVKYTIDSSTTCESAVETFDVTVVNTPIVAAVPTTGLIACENGTTDKGDFGTSTWDDIILGATQSAADYYVTYTAVEVDGNGVETPYVRDFQESVEKWFED